MAYTAIDNPELYFQTKIYAANNTDSTAITLDGDEDMSPNMCWWKNRSAAYSHRIIDTVRGVTKILTPDTAAAEATNSNALASFDSDGFTLNADGDGYGLNYDNTHNIVAWCWKESATSGFDIVSYTGNGSARTISHSLSAVPKMIIVKDRDNGDYSWHVYHEAVGNGKTLYLDLTNAPSTDSIYWNDTTPTSSVFSVGTSVTTNNNTDAFIAYLFADVQGFSKVGSYTGNGNADGAFVYTGFRPAFLMVKATVSSAWYIYDNKRAGYNVENYQLYPDRSNAEDTTDQIDLLSNGFKWRAITGDPNTSGRTYIYMAFAEAPFVNSNGVPCNAR